MRLATYARQSKTDAERVPSTEWQHAEMTRWATDRGHQVVKQHTDIDTSGYRRVARPGFDQLLATMRTGDVDGVLVWRLDRLSRQGQWGPDVLKFMDARNNTALMSVCEDIDTSTAAGELILGVRLSMARGESEAISTRWRANKRRTAEAGHLPSGGPRPYGLRDGQVDPVEAAVIRDLASRVIAGESLRSLVLELNRTGTPTSTGGPWSTTGLRTLLRQWRLAGLVTYHGEVVSEGAPAILTVEQVRHLRAILDDPTRRPGGRPATRLLSGVLVCGRCRKKMRGAKRNSKPAYACPAKPDGCGGVAIISEPLDADVTDALRSVLARTRLRAKPPDTSEEAALLQRLDELDAEQTALAQDYAAGNLGRQGFAAASLALEHEADRVRASLGRERTRAQTEAVLSDSAAVFDDLPMDRKRLVVAQLIDTITIAPAVAPRNRYDFERVTIDWA